MLLVLDLAHRFGAPTDRHAANRLIHRYQHLHMSQGKAYWNVPVQAALNYMRWVDCIESFLAVTAGSFMTTKGSLVSYQC